jgi:hypothetical protein
MLVIVTTFTLFLLGEFLTRRVVRRRMQEAFDYVHQKFGPEFTAKFPAKDYNDRHFQAFLSSRETFGDDHLAALKQQAIAATRHAMWPLLAVLVVCLVAWVGTAILALLR